MKIVLICGNGFGKSTIGKALQDSYNAKGVLNYRYIWGEETPDDIQPTEFLLRLKKEGERQFLIIETNLPPNDLPFTPWQIITISGGRS